AVRYTWAFSTLTTATLSKLAFWVPSGTAGASLSLFDVQGLPASGTVALSGQQVTYTLASATSVAADIKVYVAVDGFTNTSSAADYRSTVFTLNNAAPAAQVNAGTSNSITI